MNTIFWKILSVAALLCWPAAAQPVTYELRFPAVSHHEAEVLATFSGLPPAPLELVMSRASPGRYSLHEFARNVYNVRATDGQGKTLAIQQKAPNEWSIAGHSGSVRLQYTVFGDQVDGTYNAIDLTHAHLNGPATFLWARGLESRPVRVKLAMPAGVYWEVATQLKREEENWWSAPSRDALMDSPIEFSAHKVREWSVGEAKFRIALHAAADESAVDDYAKLCEAVTREAAGVFGALPRFDNGAYTFLLDYQPYATSDAMEHRNSTFISRATELNKRTYGDLVDSVAHEFFHAWNVERIRPRSLEPFNFEKANMSGELWFAEGFTNYYGPLVMARAGIVDVEGFATELSFAADTFLNSSARKTVNAPAMSRMAPLFDRAQSGEVTNQTNSFVSYYYVGEMLGLGIDLAIRSSFPGKSLDDWMRTMWLAHPDVDHPYTEADLERTLAQVTSESFARGIFDRYVRGTETMEYETLLARAGLALKKPGSEEAWFGAPRLSFPGRGMIVTGPVLRNSPAFLAGIDRGDRIVAVDGKEIKDQKEWDRILKGYKPGDQSRFQVEGRSGRRNVGVKWEASPQVAIVTFESVKQAITPEIAAFRKAWLGSRAIQPMPKLP